MVDFQPFLSRGRYIFLPFRNGWKVILNTLNTNIRQNSFQLYNPFSLKAKFLKLIAFKFPFLIPNVSVNESGEFHKFLETNFKCELFSSLYRATDDNKYIIQLQNKNGIIGYCKVSITTLGRERIKKELEAVTILKGYDNFNVPSILLSGHYENHYFIIYEPIEIKTKVLDLPKLYSLLSSFKRYKLSFEDHPRVRELYEFAFLSNLHKVATFLESWKNKLYWVVYEHGDFAPWNVILSKENKIYLIDFELFEEQGFEDLDLIKYYFQVFLLLKKKKNIVKALITKLNQFVSDFEIKFVLFLLSEIKRKKEENKDFSFYKNLLISYLELLDER